MIVKTTGVMILKSHIYEYFRKEVAPKSRVELYVTWLGVERTTTGSDWIFSVNEFEVKQVDAKP